MPVWSRCCRSRRSSKGERCVSSWGMPRWSTLRTSSSTSPLSYATHTTHQTCVPRSGGAGWDESLHARLLNQVTGLISNLTA